jgi:hypothetical protein
VFPLDAVWAAADRMVQLQVIARECHTGMANEADKLVHELVHGTHTNAALQLTEMPPLVGEEGALLSPMQPMPVQPIPALVISALDSTALWGAKADALGKGEHGTMGMPSAGKASIGRHRVLPELLHGWALERLEGFKEAIRAALPTAIVEGEGGYGMEANAGMVLRLRSTKCVKQSASIRKKLDREEERQEERGQADLAGKAVPLTDLLRASVSCKRVEGMLQAVDGLKGGKELRVVRIENQFHSRTHQDDEGQNSSRGKGKRRSSGVPGGSLEGRIDFPMLIVNAFYGEATEVPLLVEVQVHLEPVLRLSCQAKRLACVVHAESVGELTEHASIGAAERTILRRDKEIAALRMQLNATAASAAASARSTHDESQHGSTRSSRGDGDGDGEFNGWDETTSIHGLPGLK